jgi:thymidylate synthase
MVQQYLDHCRDILTSDYSLFKGGSKEVPLISLFGYQNEYDLRHGFPLLTTKKMFVKSLIHELLWFMKGDTNIKYLVDNNVSIWTRDAFNHNLEKMASEGIFPWGLAKYSSDWNKALEDYGQRIKEEDKFAERWGDLGPVYGSQWRNWLSVGENGEVIKVDQFMNVIESLRKKPTSKKIILSAWNPGELKRMALEPCHVLSQFNSDGEILDLQMYQRSCDQLLGVPFNIASYAMLTQIIAQQSDLEPRRFIHVFGDSHFYSGTGERGEWYGKNLPKLKKLMKEAEFFGNYPKVLDWIENSAPKELDSDGKEREEKNKLDHVTAILEQLSRKPKDLPRMTIAQKPFDELTIDDFNLIGYESHSPIRRAMAV